MNTFNCHHCANTDPQQSRHYDGCLGYEAVVCLKCGAYHDQQPRKPDAWSLTWTGLYRSCAVIPDVDRPLLLRQKSTLFAVLTRKPKKLTPEEKEHFEGVLNLLDAITDSSRKREAKAK